MDKLSPLATPSATREVLERHGLYTKYGLGQNFLVNDGIIRSILELADAQPSDVVLEVGPGIGTLTYALLSAGAQVVAVEKDPDLPAVLADTLGEFEGTFRLLHMDALELTENPFQLQRSSREVPKTTLPTPNKMVSNLPYSVAATLVLEYMQRFSFLESATIMVQKEVADRMTASPSTKAYGAYTVKLGLVARPAGRFSVAPGNFFPPPHVESAVLRLERQLAEDADGRPLTPEQLAAASLMADAAFATRRKTLANSCKNFFAGRAGTLDSALRRISISSGAAFGQGEGGSAGQHAMEGANRIVNRQVDNLKLRDIPARLPHLLAVAGVDPHRRGETLSQQEFIRLGCALLALG